MYYLNTNGLRVLNLKHESMNDFLIWIGILLDNRKPKGVSGLADEFSNAIKRKYRINYRGYDVIQGFRDDDSYFSYMREFLSNTVSYEKITKAFRLGNLGSQTVLISKKSFDRIAYLGSYLSPDDAVLRYRSRDLNARSSLNSIQDSYRNTFAQNIMRGLEGETNQRK